MANKVTIKDQFIEVAEVLRGVGRDDLAEFVDGRVAVLDKKASSKKATAHQEENAVLKGEIVAFLAEGGRYRAGELAGKFEVTPSRMTALLSQLAKAGEIDREVEKKVAYFKATA